MGFNRFLPLDRTILCLFFFLPVRFPLFVADPAVGSRSRSATRGWTDEEESVDEEGDDLRVHPCVGCRRVRAAPGWFRWRLVYAGGLWLARRPWEGNGKLLCRGQVLAAAVGGWCGCGLGWFLEFEANGTWRWEENAEVGLYGEENSEGDRDPQLLLVPGPKILKAKVSGARLVGWDLRGNGGNGDGCREDESLGFLPFRRLQGEECFLGLGFFFCWLPFPL